MASYLFPAGGRRGTTVDLHVGGLFLHKDACWELLGPGVALASPHLGPAHTLWFEGPMLPLPESQAAEDYPERHGRQRHDRRRRRPGRPPRPRLDRAGRRLRPRLRRRRPARDRRAGDRRRPRAGGRAAARHHQRPHLPAPECGCCWTFQLHKGQSVACEVCAARLGSPLDSYLEVVGPDGRLVAENDDAFGADSFVRFTATADGKYGVRIRDANGNGGPAYVYRLTLTSDPTSSASSRSAADAARRRASRCTARASRPIRWK